MTQHKNVTLVTVRSSSEVDLTELRNHLESFDCSTGPVTREAAAPDLNLDPDLALEIVFKVLVPIATSMLPKLVEWAIAATKQKRSLSKAIIIEIKGKRIKVTAGNDPEAIRAATAAALGS